MIFDDDTANEVARDSLIGIGIWVAVAAILVWLIFLR